MRQAALQQWAPALRYMLGPTKRGEDELSRAGQKPACWRRAPPFIGVARAVGNLIGNCVATVVVAAWEGDLDRAKAAKVLEGGELVDVIAG